MRQRGEVMVAWKVTMFKKIKFHTHENVGWGSISIPEQEMHTTAFWIVPPQSSSIATTATRSTGR